MRHGGLSIIWSRGKRTMKKINLILIACLTLLLQSCFFVAGAAAGAAAITIVYDQRTVDSILQDQRIDRDILNKIHTNLELRHNTHVNVTSFGQVVLLTGEVPNAEFRRRIEEIAKSVKGVNRIYNAINIQGPTTSLSHANDAWITAKIKTEMLATKGLKSASIKVVTENGTVYLMGTVTPAQEETVVRIARNTAGVLKVIKIFQYKSSSASVPGNSSPEVESSSNAVATPQGEDDLKPLVSGS
jgi:osmotically-inducible protein OsmY